MIMKKIYKVLIIFFLIFLFTGCAAITDGTYIITEDYYISAYAASDHRLESNILDRNESDSKTNDFVKEYRYNDKYIFLKIIRKELFDSYRKEYNTVRRAVKNIPEENIKYYIVNLNENKMYGSYSLEEFKEKIEDIDQTNMTEWDDTTDGIELEEYDYIRDKE